MGMAPNIREWAYENPLTPEWYAITADADYSGKRTLCCITKDYKSAITRLEREYFAWPGKGNVKAEGPFYGAADAHQGWRRNG